jgi:hypothetical protein
MYRSSARTSNTVHCGPAVNTCAYLPYRYALPAAFLLLAGAAPAIAAQAPSKPRSGECEFSAADEAWLRQSEHAWLRTLRKHAEVEPPPITAIIFDARCRRASSSALSGGKRRWAGSTHRNQIGLPDGSVLPPQVISFAAPAQQSAFFVMSTPSVWAANNVPGRGLNLEQLMTAVLIHEASHVLQFATYGARLTSMSKEFDMPDDFNDDSIQQQFGKEEKFASSVRRETALLFEAATVEDDREALARVREARRLMQERQRMWFTEEQAHLREAEDIFLTMEGSGQWLAYRWLTDHKGAAIAEDLVTTTFARRGKWSQQQGAALFLALERLGVNRWKSVVFGTGSQTALQILDARLAEGTEADQ